MLSANSLNMISSRLLLLPVFILSSLSSFSQKNENGLPDDLNVESIVFLKFDSMYLEPGLSKAKQRDIRWRNDMGTKGNEALMEEVKKYPFKYTVASRSQLKDLSEKGYKYILENDMMNGYNSGDPMFRPFEKYVAPFYVMDLQTGKKYFLFTISQTFAYRYDYTMGKFVEKVIKKYKVKS
jgi:hypothetical protein